MSLEKRIAALSDSGLASLPAVKDDDLSPRDDAARPGDLGEAERERVIDFALRSLNARSKEAAPNADSLRDAVPVRGYDHEGAFSLERFLAASATTGFQATNLARAVEILREVRDRGVPLYLGFTSNMGTCGLRETLTYLARERHVRALVTTAGAIEEDVMKVFMPFVLGDSRANGRDLRERRICRTGNIFIPTSRYARLHILLYLLHKRLLREQGAPSRAAIDMLDYARELGRELELRGVPRREESFVYWAYKNAIPCHCPVLLDGAIGDALYYFRREQGLDRLVVDASDCHFKLIDDMAFQGTVHGTVAIFVIGGSVPKHMLCNSAIFAGGARHAVYVNTATEADGSNAGAPVDEAVTWGKIHPDARSVKVEGEASLVVPLIVAGAFQECAPRGPIAVAEPGAAVAR
jgi:deoxyhypusine synthase